MKTKIKKNLIVFFIVPSLIGMVVFYFIPSLFSLYYSFTDFAGGFVGLRNFGNVLSNLAFRTAAQNSVLFIAVVLVLSTVISFFLASLLQKIKSKKIWICFFMLPLVIPSGSVVFFYNVLFAHNGAVNRVLLQLGMDTPFWFSADYNFFIIVIMFLFRNVGFNLVLFLAGFQTIPESYYEAAKIEGGSKFAILKNITGVYIMPTLFLVVIMTIVNSFRIFRELYLLFGSFPAGRAYMMQHFMNNQFAIANLQVISTAATILSVVVAILVVGFFIGQKKLSDNFGGV